jgi:hypothetical protein
MPTTTRPSDRPEGRRSELQRQLAEAERIKRANRRRMRRMVLTSG